MTILSFLTTFDRRKNTSHIWGVHRLFYILLKKLRSESTNNLFINPEPNPGIAQSEAILELSLSNCLNIIAALAILILSQTTTAKIRPTRTNKLIII